MARAVESHQPIMSVVEAPVPVIAHEPVWCRGCHRFVLPIRKRRWGVLLVGLLGWLAGVYTILQMAGPAPVQGLALVMTTLLTVGWAWFLPQGPRCPECDRGRSSSASDGS